MPNIDIENAGADLADLQHALRTVANYSIWPANTIMFPAHYSSTGAAAVIAGSAFFVPFRIFQTTTITKMGFFTTIAGSAGAQAKFALYTDNGGYPGTLVQDGGAVAVDGATGHLETTAFSKALEPAQYWGLIMVNGTAGASYERYSGVVSNMVFNTGALGASLTLPRSYTATMSYASGPPATAPAVVSSTSNAPVMTLRN